NPLRLQPLRQAHQIRRLVRPAKAMHHRHRQVALLPAARRRDFQRKLVSVSELNAFALRIGFKENAEKTADDRLMVWIRKKWKWFEWNLLTHETDPQPALYAPT